jgi:hypothetical protein
VRVALSGSPRHQAPKRTRLSAVTMEHDGAKQTDIQAPLGHANAATTGVYLQRLHAGDSAYTDDVAALVGIGPTLRRKGVVRHRGS